MSVRYCYTYTSLEELSFPSIVHSNPLSQSQCGTPTCVTGL